MEPLTDPAVTEKLEAARRQREVAERRLREAERREQDILIQAAIDRNPEFQRMLRVRSKIKSRLHRVRQNIQKKGVAIRIREEALDLIRREHKGYCIEAEVRSKQLDAIDRRLKTIKESLAARRD